MRLQLIALALLSACHGSTGSTADAFNACANETRAQTYVVGLDNLGLMGKMDFKMMSAMPAPPARGDNTWVVQVNTMANGVDGGPVTGASMTAIPFMPDHGHGTAIMVNITAMPTAGEYQLTPVNLWMPGYWETTITATANGVTDSTIYKFCIPN